MRSVLRIKQIENIRSVCIPSLTQGRKDLRHLRNGANWKLITTSSVVFLAVRISYIRFFTAVHIYDFHISTFIIHHLDGLFRPNLQWNLQCWFFGDQASHTTDNQLLERNCFPFLENKGYTPWSPWSECKATCGEGTQFRKRFRTNTPRESGGTSCKGINEETQSQKCSVMQSSPPGICVFDPLIKNSFRLQTLRYLRWIG